MRIISLLLCVILCVSLALTSCGSNAEQVSSGEESNVVSETDISSVITDESLDEKSASEVSAPADPEQTETAAKLYNVRDYGAKGNGDADDSAAFQAALDDAAKKGGTVWVPAGKYNIAKTLYKKGKVSLKAKVCGSPRSYGPAAQTESYSISPTPRFGELPLKICTLPTG
ncbi:MAG: hypothetical protein J6X52_03320 [Clostridia bacterium]|nr:hypothetical protein [Clostridia bacterium]